MKMIRCRICGEVYLGSETPSHCPFCGAHREHLIDSTEYPADINDVQLTEVERADLEAAIDVERSNTRFYLGMSKHKSEDVLSSAYKRLAKIEAEHCELFCKLAGVDEPDDLSVPMEVPTDWCLNIADSLEREKHASSLYETFAARATNERIREVFEAIGLVEADHIVFDGVTAAYARCE